jgi:hypothetical protein
MDTDFTCRRAVRNVENCGAINPIGAPSTKERTGFAEHDYNQQGCALDKEGQIDAWKISMLVGLAIGRISLANHDVGGQCVFGADFDCDSDRSNCPLSVLSTATGLA